MLGRVFYLLSSVAMVLGSLATPTPAFSEEKISAPVRSSLLTPFELLQDDKEEGTVVLEFEDLEDSKRILGDTPEVSKKLETLAQKIAPMIFPTQGNVCEAVILDELYTLSIQEGLIQKRSKLRAVLAGLRVRNLLDDVILLPLWRALPAYVRLGAFQPEAPVPGATAPTRILDRANHSCPTVSLFSLRTQLKTEQGRKYTRGHLWSEIKSAYQNEQINDQTYAWLGALEQAGFDRVPFTLSMVAPKIRDVKNKSSLKSALGTPSSFASKIRKKSRGLSQRIHLYQKYNAEQILLIGDMFYRFSHNLTAARTELLRTFSEKDANGEVKTFTTSRKLNPVEEYNAAVNELHLEFVSDAKDGDLFQGHTIDFDEVAMATLEVGVLSGKDMNLILKVKEMWDPQLPQWKKILKVVVTYGGPALIFVPPPFNIISSMALILLQSTVLKPASTKHGHDLGTELL